MGSFFCAKSRIAKLNDQEVAIFKSKQCRDNIKSYIKRLERNEKLRRDKAKEEVRKSNRDKAKVFLNQSKFYREQINVASGQLNMIEEQISRIEMAQHQKEAIQVLEQGNKILKALNEEVNIDKWEKIADDMNEVKQQQDEIGNYLRSHNIDETEFDEQVTKDLEKLMNDENVVLPDAGSKEIKNESPVIERQMIPS
jgi:charged multivesicular body protein 6